MKRKGSVGEPFCKAFHGMPLRILLGEGNSAFIGLLFSKLNPEQICYVGLRDLDEP
jgi:arginase